MAAYSSIIPPNSLGELVRPIVEMSDAEFVALNTAVSGPRSFSLKKEDVERLRNQLPASAAKNLTFLLTGLSFLYSHLARQIEGGMPYADAVQATVDELEDEAHWGDKNSRAILSALSSTNPPAVA